jgi:hypothetical protein
MCTVAAVLALGAAWDGHAAGTAKGDLAYKSKSGVINMTPKFAYLVKGPDAVDAGKTIRKVVLSATDLESKIAACSTMSCTDADLGDGMTIDLDAGPRVNYWVVLNGQRVQYSGTATTSALALTTDTPTRVAGKLAIDDTAAGGPKLAVEFDAPLVKEVKKAR